jgi:DNA end-binding protein Ku
MPRAIWSGSVSFGLVNIPVKLFSAVSQKEVRFHMLHDADGGRIRLHRFCEVEEKEVPYEHIVKGYEVSPGRYVTLTEEELAAADPKAARSVDIEEFVGVDDIDPIYYDRTYYLAPDRGAGKAYALLLETMRRTKKVAIGRVVLRTKQSLCCLRPLGEVLALATLNWADEVNARDGIVGEAGEPAGRELEMAERLVDSLSAPFEPDKYRDEYREKVLALIERKAAGEEVVAPEEPAQPAKVVNLADALAASLAAAKGDRDGGRAKGAAGRDAPRAKAANDAEASGARHHRPAAAARTARTRKPKKA